jgi:PAS domain S-box-containing protein
MKEKRKSSVNNHAATRWETESRVKQDMYILEAVTEKLGAGLILLDKNYGVLWANQVLKRHMGVEDKACFAAFHNLSAVCSDCGAKKIFEKEIDVDTRECISLDGQGNQIWTEFVVTPIKDDSGTIIGALELELPITKRKKIEQALQESEEKFRAISNSLVDGIFLVDGQGRISYCNPSAERIFGYNMDEAIGKNGMTLFAPPGSRQKATHEGESLKNQLIGDSERAMETFGVRKDGLEIPIEVSTAQIQFGGKNYGLHIVRDITEQKRLQKKLNDYSQHLKSMIEIRTMQLKDANDRLLKTERLAAIGELAGMVGHDLRNPLAGMRGAVYYLKKKFGSCLSDEGLKMLKTIDECISYSDKIINDLLDYSREIRIELTETTPDLMVKTALSLFEIPNKITLTNEAEAEPSLKSDKEKMIRVFVNLIKNACDAMPDGGKLRITTQKAKNKVVFSFEDSGVGMTKETLNKIWTPLFTTKAKGMGFGLAICKRIVEAHGGTIALESSIGKGTKVTIALPTNPTPSNEKNTWVSTEKLLAIKQA